LVWCHWHVGQCGRSLVPGARWTCLSHFRKAVISAQASSRAISTLSLRLILIRRTKFHPTIWDACQATACGQPALRLLLSESVGRPWRFAQTYLHGYLPDRRGLIRSFLVRRSIQNRDSIRWPWPGNGKNRDETDSDTSDRFSRFNGQNRRSFDCAFRMKTAKAFAQDDTSFEKVEHFTTGNARAICNSRSLRDDK
jgi:hypothetical protein